jgi:hypothetical protein
VVAWRLCSQDAIKRPSTRHPLKAHTRIHDLSRRTNDASRRIQEQTRKSTEVRNQELGGTPSTLATFFYPCGICQTHGITVVSIQSSNTCTSSMPHAAYWITLLRGLALTSTNSLSAVQLAFARLTSIYRLTASMQSIRSGCFQYSRYTVARTAHPYCCLYCGTPAPHRLDHLPNQDRTFDICWPASITPRLRPTLLSHT